ncbi:SH3 domain-containing protein [Pelagimonas varians]|uniref:Bacterial SH3 domain protein n=1 Tax=Pelagimonas varians TaxID=696760 RepID=A0A238K799_9RHOB|nr:SH3 domain-containing protein [Pelagimonas varians]PYG31698.1 SH3 domain-containing protein [Pelagimonas varians]SMX38758.1 Bacterial SH3 domain protein [Pelagimonas varians]
MSRVIFVALIAIALGTTLDPKPAAAGSLGNYEVFGVDNDDMLKLRAGPGIGYKVILGLPNGTALRVHSCQQTGATRWCNVSLKKARGLKGHVSWAYLRKM